MALGAHRLNKLLFVTTTAPSSGHCWPSVARRAEPRGPMQAGQTRRAVSTAVLVRIFHRLFIAEDECA